MYILLCNNLLFNKIVTFKKGTFTNYKTIIKLLCKEGFKAFAISTLKRAENGKI